MGTGFKPDLMITKLEAINAEVLEKHQLQAIIVDLDNTILPWRGKDISDQTKQWFQLNIQAGIKFCIVSNNSSRRVSRLAGDLGIPAISRAAKPRRKNFRRALRVLDTAPENTAVVGDQIFTDVLGGNRMGLFTILVSPINKYEFIGTRLVRKLEKLFLKRL
ncbi:MAG: YqeG family HAD IIIA-type phosphatase [Carboxydocellales bacterium]